jgi:hypothetical protein
MADVRFVDVTDLDAFRLVPPCADKGFDHRSCDYWEDAEKGSKAARLSWVAGLDGAGTGGGGAGGGTGRPRTGNPFLDDLTDREPDANPFGAGGHSDSANPFASGTKAPAFNPFAVGDDDPLADNPFAPRPKAKVGQGLRCPTSRQDTGMAMMIRGAGGTGGDQLPSESGGHDQDRHRNDSQYAHPVSVIRDLERANCLT